MTFESQTLRRHPMGPLATEVLQAALDAVDPRALVRAWARMHLGDVARLRVLAAGKAAAPMARGLLDAAPGRVVGGAIASKRADAVDGLESVVGDHPVPSEASLRAGATLLRAAADARPGDTVLALISGGASALVEAPAADVHLDDIVALTRARLGDATAILRLNAQRRSMSRIKGGGLARAVDSEVPIIALVLCDVVGGGPHDVGSGPFDDPRVRAHVLADNDTAVQAAARAAQAAGAQVELTAFLQGEARIEGVRWAHARMQAPPTDAVRCTIAGGETVVTVRGHGRGGRNQELALAAAPALMGDPHALLVTLATDGEDGPTDAAGAAVDGSTIARALERGLDPDGALRDNDSFSFFDALGDLLRPGPTGTNVCDLTVAFT